MTAVSRTLPRPVSGTTDPPNKKTSTMTPEGHTRAPAADRRDQADRRTEHHTDRRAYDRYSTVGAHRADRRRAERRRPSH